MGNDVFTLVTKRVQG